MRVTILGCGTSTGVPLPGCKCAVCLSPEDKNKRLRASALLSLKTGENLLIDTSPDLRQQSLKHGLTSLDGVLYTHAHADHILGIEDLRAFNFIHRRQIPCYGTSATCSAIRKTFYYIFDPDPNYLGGMPPQISLHHIEEFVPFEVLGVKVCPFLLWHGRTPVTGFRINDFAYATDCKIIPPESRALLQGLKVLVLDGLGYENHRAHMTVAEAVKTATEIGAERTIITHMGHSVDFEKASATLPSGVELAFDGLQFDI